MTFSTHGVVLESPNPFWLLSGTMHRLSRLYDFLMFSSVFLSLAGMAMVYISCVLQGIPLSLPALLIMFLTPFSIYNLNKKTDEDEDAVNRRDRYAFTKRYEKSLSALAWVSYAAAFLIAAFFGIPSLLVVSIPLVSGILYSMRWLPASFPYRRLKEIPVVKNALVAFAWASIAALLPVCLAHGIPDVRTFITFAFLFSPVFIGSIIPDIRDKEGDALAGIRTIPVIIGAKHTSRLLSAMNFLIGLVVFLGCIHTIPPVFTVIVAAGFVYMHCCIHIFMKHRENPLVCDLLVDGQFIFFSIGILGLASLRFLP